MRIFRAGAEGLPAGDRGLAYGDGLFETIRMQGCRGTLVGRHLHRLCRDAARLGIEVAPAELQQAFRQAAGYYGSRRGDDGWVLKLILTRGQGGRGYRPDPDLLPHLVLSASPLPAMPEVGGVCVEFSRIPLVVNPFLAGMKTLNRLEQVMAARELDSDTYEVLMSDLDGRVVEGSRTNLLLRRDNVWLTPPASCLAVAGVMRQWVLECLKRRGETVLERPLRPDEVLDGRCQGLYLMNSVVGVVPVRRLAGQDLPVAGDLATICNLLETLE